MLQSFLLYATSTILLLAGFLCFAVALKKQTAKEKMIKALQRPLPKNVGKPYFWLLGIFLIISAIILIVKSK